MNQRTQISSTFVAIVRGFGMLLAAAVIGGCGGQLSSTMDCGGEGAVRGKYENVNDGKLEFKQGVAWRNDAGSYTVLFTGDPVLAKALRASPDPDSEAARLGQVLGELLVGLQYHPDGKFEQRITRGTSTSSGRSNRDEGHAAADAQGCLRGDVKLSGYGFAHFALPLLAPEKIAATIGGGVEADSRAQQPLAPASVDDEADALTRWSAAWTRLNEVHPVSALQAMGFSSPVAAALADDKRALAALKRMRGQCPEASTASVNEYDEVVGDSHPRPEIVLNGTGAASIGPQGGVIDNCYVMKRNDQYIDQCWPLSQDCTSTPLYNPDS
jgi:hypothetical protein